MASEKRRIKDKEATRRLFEEKRHIGGRLPDILNPTPTPSPEPPTETFPEREPPSHALTLPTSTRTKGPRSQKRTGLQLILSELKQRGFPHPQVHGGFLMVPREFKALLSLEPLSVTQVVYEIFEQTIGWKDAREDHGRREWAKLSLRHFQLSCGMTLSQVQRGLKGALNSGYVIRRPRMGAYEYSIRWRDIDAEKDA